MNKKGKKVVKSIKKRNKNAEKLVKTLLMCLVEKYGLIQTEKMLKSNVESSCAIEREG